jgi:hypothetical protein
MSALAEHVRDYLQVRGALRFKLDGEGRPLREFVAFADAAGQSTVTAKTALEWARLPRGGSPELSVAAAAGGPRLRALPRGARPGLRVPPL